jgi:hypothetical protein
MVRMCHVGLHPRCERMAPLYCFTPTENQRRYAVDPSEAECI